MFLNSLREEMASEAVTRQRLAKMYFVVLPLETEKDDTIFALRFVKRCWFVKRGS